MAKKRNYHVIITAAGSGSRYKNSNGTKPKQYLLLNGKPVILHSLLKFQKCSDIKSIYISAMPQFFSYLHSLVAKHKITKLKAMVEGGKTRFDSVKNAFNQIVAGLNDIILIHDAARPNLTKADLDKIISESSKYGEVIPAVKIPETVKKVNKSTVEKTIPRDDLWLVQTPQAFRYEVLSKAYILAGERNDYTDEAAMAEHAGFTVRVSECSRSNMKITTQDDLELLKRLMKK